MEENWKLTSQSIQVTTSMHDSIHSHQWHSCNAAILIRQEFMPTGSTCALVCLKWYYLRCQIQNQHIYGSNQFPPPTHAQTHVGTHAHTHKHREKQPILRRDKVCERFKYCTQKFRI